MKRTNEEILERYLSADSVDFFNAQRTALICMLPFNVARPYLEPSYVAAHDEGTLPEEEKWVEDFDLNKQITDFFPAIYKGLDANNEMYVSQGLLYLKGWIWAIDPEFYDEIEPLYEEEQLDFGKSIVDKIANHFGYVPTVQDVDFEDLPEEHPIEEEEEEGKNHLWEEDEEEIPAVGDSPTEG